MGIFDKKKKEEASQSKPIKSQGDNSVFFERYALAKPFRNDTCIIVDEMVEYGLLIVDGFALDTIQGGRNYVFRDNDYFQGKSPIDVDIIFMSKKAKIQIAWGSPTGFDFKDPVYDVDVHVGASGVLEVQVGNPRKFFSEVVGRDSVYNKEKLKEKIKTRLISRIQPAIAEFMKENKLSYIDFTQNTLKIADGIQPVIRADLADQYGVNMFDFIIEAIVISDTDKAAIKAKRERLEQKPEQDQEKALDRADFVSERDFQHAVEMRKLDIEERKAAAPVYHNSAPSKTVCPHCNTELPAGAKFCFSCGRSPKNVCPDCKIENPPQAKFCLSCGKKLH